MKWAFWRGVEWIAGCLRLKKLQVTAGKNADDIIWAWVCREQAETPLGMELRRMIEEGEKKWLMNGTSSPSKCRQRRR